MTEADERAMLILMWLAEGHTRLLQHAARQLCPMLPSWAAPVVPAGTMFVPAQWRPSLADPISTWWRCRVCGEHVSIVARMAADPVVEEHRIDHCERWLAEHRYVVPGRYEHRDVLADVLSLAFSTLARTVR